MKKVRFFLALIAILIVNIFTVGYHNELTYLDTTLVPVENLNDMGLEELRLKLDIINLKLDSLQDEKLTHITSTNSIN